jgi:hypothetical protein
MNTMNRRYAKPESHFLLSFILSSAGSLRRRSVQAFARNITTLTLTALAFLWLGVVLPAGKAIGQRKREAL